MDVDFWMKMAARKMKFRYVDYYFTYFRRHGEAKSAGGNLPFIEETMNSDYFRNNLAEDSFSYYLKVKKLMISDYFRNLALEHKTNEFFKTFFRFVWSHPVISLRFLSGYITMKFGLFVKNRLNKKI